MAETPELQVQQKREVDKAQESTTPARAFMPTADIFETEEALNVVLEMPGVSKENVDINVEEGVLTVEGRIDFQKYEGLRPVYSEYNVGPYRRSFRLSNQVDQAKITAEMQDGVITLTLPKAEKADRRRLAPAMHEEGRDSKRPSTPVRRSLFARRDAGRALRQRPDGASTRPEPPPLLRLAPSINRNRAYIRELRSLAGRLGRFARRLPGARSDPLSKSSMAGTGASLRPYERARQRKDIP